MVAQRNKVVLASGVGLFGATVVGALLARARLPVRDDPTENEIALVSIFDGSALRPTSKSFLGGTITSVFGGSELDLRRVSLGSGHADLRVTTIFGGTEITVPDGWKVTVEGPTVAGGVDTAVTDEAILGPGAPMLRIQACTFFGGLQVVARPVLRTAGESA